jgi:hydroxymethylbilane synthase
LKRIVIGTRSSKLALWQAEWVAVSLRRIHPDLEVIIQHITTKGDVVADVPLPKIGDKGLFTREIETALLAGQIHLAVHSLKDLPTELPSGLAIGAITAREDARDVLISRHGVGLDDLPRGARIGTSSLRRGAQLAAHRPEAQIVNLRGNVDTRLRKAATDDYDAIVLAAAGVLRLGLADRIVEYLPIGVMLPAVGQGAMAVEARQDDADTLALVADLDHAPTRAATDAERAFLRALGGGCHVPIAAYGETHGDALRLRGLIASLDGQRIVRGEVVSSVSEAGAAGRELAERLLAQGGQEIWRP